MKKSDHYITGQELRVLQLLATGISHKKIGEKIFVSTRTVNGHVFKLSKKLKAKNAVEMILKAFFFQIIERPVIKIGKKFTVRKPVPEKFLEVLKLTMEGFSKKEIAQKLSIPFRTAQFYMTELFYLFGVSKATRLAVVALQEGVVELPNFKEEGIVTTTHKKITN